MAVFVTWFILFVTTAVGVIGIGVFLIIVGLGIVGVNKDTACVGEQAVRNKKINKNMNNDLLNIQVG